MIFAPLSQAVKLTLHAGDRVVVERQLLEVQAVLKALHLGDVVVVERGPAQVNQLVEVSQPGDTLAVQGQGRDLLTVWSTQGTFCNDLMYVKSRFLNKMTRTFSSPWIDN